MYLPTALVNNHGDGTLFDRTKFTYQAESDTFLCPAGQTLARKQLSRKDRAVCTTGSTGSVRKLCAKIAMHDQFPALDLTAPARRGRFSACNSGPRQKRCGCDDPR